MVLFALNGEAVCIVHVMLNALDFEARGWEAQIVVEGSSTKLVPLLAKTRHAFHGLYRQAMDKELFAAMEKEGIPLLGDPEMADHPRMADWMEKGFEVVSF